MASTLLVLCQSLLFAFITFALMFFAFIIFVQVLSALRFNRASLVFFLLARINLMAIAQLNVWSTPRKLDYKCP